MNSAGFGTIEAIVAMALLALVTAGVASTVVFARRVQTDAARERHATQLAVAALERMRAGVGPASGEESEGFKVTAELAPCNTNSRLLEARVRVSWGENFARGLELTTLILR